MMSDSILHSKPGNAIGHSFTRNEQLMFAIIPACVNFASGIFAVAINSVLLYILVQNHKSGSRVLICNLAITDLLTGLVVQQSYAIHMILSMKAPNYVALYMFNFTAYLVCGLSLVTAGGMSLDRLIATLFPFWYKIRAKPRVFTFTVVFIWVQGVGFLTLYLSGVINNTLAQLAFSLTVCFAVLSFAISYPLIARNFRLREKRVTQSSSLPSAAATELRQQRQAKVTRTFAFMVIALCLMYLPMVVVKLLLWKASDTHLKTLDIINRVTNTVAFLNSSLNPMLYCYGNNAVRAEIKQCFANFFSRFIGKRTVTQQDGCTSSS